MGTRYADAWLGRAPARARTAHLGWRRRFRLVAASGGRIARWRLSCARRRASDRRRRGTARAGLRDRAAIGPAMGAVRVSHRQPASAPHDYRPDDRLSRHTWRRATAATSTDFLYEVDAALHAGDLRRGTS